MKFLLSLLALFSIAHSQLSSGFRVRWTNTANTNGYFIDVPEAVTDAASSGWTEVDRLDGKFLELSMYCYQNEVSFCAFYDANGHVRGFQIALLQSAYSNGPVSLDQLGYSTWRFNYLDYWTMQQFFINDASQTSWDSSKLLQENAVFVPTLGAPDTLMKISTNITDLDTTLFSKQGCIPTMGTHYIYDALEDCDTLFPWFFMFNGDQLVASGWWIFGNYEWSTRHYRPTVDVFEYANLEFFSLVAPSVASCFSDYVEQYGLITFHVYYINDYSQLTC